MLYHTEDTHIVELAPGRYWMTSGVSHHVVEDPSQATRVSEHFNLEKSLPGKWCEKARVVRVHVTVEEFRGNFSRYAQHLERFFSRLQRGSPLSSEEERGYVELLQKCKAELSGAELVDLEALVTKLRWEGVYRVYLDDDAEHRPTPEGWLRVMTAGGAIAVLESLNVSHLSLDHDLGTGFGSGYDVACWLETAVLECGYPMPVVTIHSQNGVGIENIRRALDSIARKLADRGNSGA